MRNGREKMHTCSAPGCVRWIPLHFFACGQHRTLLGYDLSVRMQTAWQERTWDKERFERTRAEAFRKWQGKPDTQTSEEDLYVDID